MGVAVVVAVWELRKGLLAKDIDLPEQPLMIGGVVMVVVASPCASLTTTVDDRQVAVW